MTEFLGDNLCFTPAASVGGRRFGEGTFDVSRVLRQRVSTYLTNRFGTVSNVVSSVVR